MLYSDSFTPETLEAQQKPEHNTTQTHTALRGFGLANKRALQSPAGAQTTVREPLFRQGTRRRAQVQSKLLHRLAETELRRVIRGIRTAH